MVSASDTSNGSALSSCPQTLASANTLLDVAVVDQHGIAPGTHTKAQVRFLYQHTHLACELAVAVGQHRKSWFIALLFAPLEHDERIVH